MKKKDIRVGKVYACKVSGEIVPVRVLDFRHPLGWYVENLTTKRIMWIVRAARLLYPMVYSDEWCRYVAAEATDA